MVGVAGDAVRALAAATGQRHQPTAQVLRGRDCQDQEAEKGISEVFLNLGS